MDILEVVLIGLVCYAFGALTVLMFLDVRGLCSCVGPRTGK